MEYPKLQFFSEFKSVHAAYTRQNSGLKISMQNGLLGGRKMTALRKETSKFCQIPDLKLRISIIV